MDQGKVAVERLCLAICAQGFDPVQSCPGFERHTESPVRQTCTSINTFSPVCHAAALQGCSTLEVAYTVNMRKVHLPFERLQAAGTPPRLLSLLRGCFEWDPQRRPSAHDVLKELLLAKAVLRAPPKAE